MAIPRLQPLPVLLLLTIVSLFWGYWMLLVTICLFIKSPRKFISPCSITSIPACAREKGSGEHGFAAIQGESKIRLHYVAAGQEGKPLMLLLHGFPECWYSWRYQLKEFSRDYRVVAVDMRGYGESDKPSGILNYSMDLLTLDVAGLVSALGYRKCILIGHDWGGAVTWAVGARFPEICEKIVILNAPHSVAMHDHVRSSWKQFMASWYVFFFQVPWLPELMIGYDDFAFLRDALLGDKMGVRNKRNVTQDDVNLLKFYYSSFGSRTSAINYYRCNRRYDSGIPKVQIKSPLLLIWGTADAALTQELATKSIRFADNGNLKFVEGASHWVQQDEPQLVNQYIREFLQK